VARRLRRKDLVRHIVSLLFPPNDIEFGGERKRARYIEL